MEFNLTVDKKIQSEIDPKLCINCGKCREFCPTGAIREYQKTVSCIFSEGMGKRHQGDFEGSFGGAKEPSYAEACSTGCPLGIVPQAALSFVKSGNVEKAYEYIRSKNPLSWVCWQVCDHPCHDACKRGTYIDEPVNMQELEGYIISQNVPAEYRYMNCSNEKVAVIGGGPAGITAAYDLAKAGYRVTIFEKDRRLGGAMNWGIPQFRLDRDQLGKEIQRVISSAIEVRCGYEIGKDLTLEDIWAEDFSACLIAVGTSEGVLLDIDGTDGKGVYDAVTVLRNINGADDTDVEIGEKVVIVGGGRLAADTARVIARKGKKVICAAVDDPEEPQTLQQMKIMAKENIEYRTLVSPKQIILEDGKVKAIELAKVKYNEDEKGWMQPVMITNSEYNLLCDTVIFAVGQKGNVENISKVETYPGGEVKIDAFHRTNKNMIFACGDVTGESGSVVEAMAAGRQAAAGIDAALGGRNPAMKKWDIAAAPTEETIYPENVQPVRGQHSKIITEGRETAIIEPTEDILSVLRSAGIQEQMLQFDGMTGEKIAIAGGGIAGVTAAISLAKKGYRPTIFEKHSNLGGSYRRFATGNRIDKDILDHELNKVECSGIPIVYNASVGIRPTLDDLFEEGYSAVLFAIGETAGRKPEIPNANVQGVFDIVTLMEKLADDEVVKGVGDKVVVMGNDEMAFDAARTLKQFCKEVTIVADCSRGRLDIKTSAVKAATEDGINIVTGVVLSRINAGENILISIDCRILENRLSVNIPCNTLVLGGTAVADTRTIAVRNPNLETGENGHFVTNDKLETTVKGVFAVGDFNMSSPDAGRAGAIAVDNYLTGGSATIAVGYDDGKELSVASEVIKGDVRSVEGFELGKQGFDEAMALLETSRCMHCGYHKADETLCMGCGICAKVCPVNAVKMSAIHADVREVK